MIFNNPEQLVISAVYIDAPVDGSKVIVFMSESFAQPICSKHGFIQEKKELSSESLNHSFKQIS